MKKTKAPATGKPHDKKAPGKTDKAAKKKATKKSATKKKMGRPSKLTPQLAIRIHYLARRGLSDNEIALILSDPPHFKLTQQTINNWKKDKDFFESLKEAKDVADDLVERSLYEKAVGYDCEEVKVFCNEGVIIKTTVIKHFPPDTTAAIFWLKNRRRKSWKDRQDHKFGGDKGFTDFINQAIDRAKAIPGGENDESRA